MSVCITQESGAIELFFYDELAPAERARVAEHLRGCRECASALEDLRMIREVLASRPDVSAPASGDWTGFMARLETAVRPQQRSAPVRHYVGLLAMAALLAIVAASVFFVARQSSRLQPATPVASRPAGADSARAVATSGLRSAGEKHFEKSKLVVLGLANRDTGVASEEWAYERELAAALLEDTRLYRMAAEQHGMPTLAGIMRDLELVLLETSMSDGVDTAELGQIQRLIQKRNLIEKMDTVASAGM